jgi:hypothetical protein
MLMTTAAHHGMQPRPRIVRAWASIRRSVADWRARERFAWQVYTALRQVPVHFSLERFERCTEGWVAEGVLLESGERFRGVHQDPYVAIRRMSLTAQHEHASSEGKPCP